MKVIFMIDLLTQQGLLATPRRRAPLKSSSHHQERREKRCIPATETIHPLRRLDDIVLSRPSPAAVRGTPERTRRLIMFRVENEERFTKRKSKHLWGSLIKDLGLEGKMTPQQFAKKWNNLKMKYKLLKEPPAGTGLWSKESYWCWFDLMDRAMTGRLGQGEGDGSVFSSVSLVEGEGSVKNPAHLANGEGSFLSPTRLVKGEWPQWSSTESESRGEGGKILQNWPSSLLLTPVGSESTAGRAQHILVQPADASVTMAMMKQDKSPRAELGRESQRLEREQAELERERLSQETVSVERERVALEKEKAGVDRERAVLDRERAVLDRERAVLDRERAVLYRARAALNRERNRLAQQKEHHLVDGLGQGTWPAVETRHKDRLLCLWDRLMDSL
ncbi:unnamed protein product [Lota lota]